MLGRQIGFLRFTGVEGFRSVVQVTVRHGSDHRVFKFIADHKLFIKKNERYMVMNQLRAALLPIISAGSQTSPHENHRHITTITPASR